MSEEEPQKNKEQKNKAAETGYTCEECARKFNSKGALQLHIWQKHTPRTPKEKNKGIVAQEKVESNYEISTRTPGFTLNPETLALAQLLVQSGRAKDLADLFKKSIYHMAYIEGGNKMVDQNQSPKETLDEIQSREIIDAYLVKLKGKDSTKEPEEDDIEKLEKQMTKQMRIRQMDRMMKGDSFDFKDLLAWQMFQGSFGGKKNDGEHADGIKQELAELKRKMETQDLINQFQRRLEGIESKKDDGNSFKDFVIALEKMRGESDKKVKEFEMKLQEERSIQLKDNMDRFEREVKEQLNNKLRSSGFDDQLQSKIKEQLLGNLDFKKLFSDGKEKTSSQAAQELISGVIDKVKEPLLAPMGQALAARIAQSGRREEPVYYPQQPPVSEEIPQQVETPQDNPINAGNETQETSTPEVNNNNSKKSGIQVVSG